MQDEKSFVQTESLKKQYPSLRCLLIMGICRKIQSKIDYLSSHFHAPITKISNFNFFKYSELLFPSASTWASTVDNTKFKTFNLQPLTLESKYLC